MSSDGRFGSSRPITPIVSDPINIVHFESRSVDSTTTPNEIVATLPQGTQVVVEAKLLTSDVDHTIEEVRQEVQQQQNGLPGGGVSRTSNRTLFCRKCEGHGQQVVLKGHASRCPFNNCQCKTCTNVMSMRANAIIRRYRTRTLEGGLVLKPVHFKNGNTRLRVFPKYVDETDALPIPSSQQNQIAKGLQLGDQIIIEKPRPTTQDQQTPPQSATIAAQPPFQVKRSYSDEFDVSRGSNSPKANEQSPPVEQPPTTMASMSLPLIELLLRQQGLNPDLIANLLPIGNQNGVSAIPATAYDNSATLFNGLSFPNTQVTYSSPNNFVPTYVTSAQNGFSDNDRKLSDAALIAPAAVQLSELNIGVTAGSPIHSSCDLAPKLTPNMFESNNSSNHHNPKPEPEEFTSNLMIAPTADRSHPLFRKFLNVVRELEKQMLTADS
ncbi:unnamed protein product [Caenorhabditis bovis]|uniref:DM domain-containing protein n=1 Tax=Caenorhabditis bovis TaxID=2654633 RepID=A0A8S1E637_9PELO|nr:unnamed protein product [Caenorhabditis bovis]